MIQNTFYEICIIKSFISRTVSKGKAIRMTQISNLRIDETFLENGRLLRNHDNRRLLGNDEKVGKRRVKESGRTSCTLTLFGQRVISRRC